MFFYFSVPNGCVSIVPSYKKIQAAPDNTSPAACEAKPDRCYWDTTLDESIAGPKCYYRQGNRHLAMYSYSFPGGRGRRLRVLASHSNFSNKRMVESTTISFYEFSWDLYRNNFLC